MMKSLSFCAMLALLVTASASGAEEDAPASLRVRLTLPLAVEGPGPSPGGEPAYPRMPGAFNPALSTPRCRQPQGLIRLCQRTSGTANSPVQQWRAPSRRSRTLLGADRDQPLWLLHLELPF